MIEDAIYRIRSYLKAAGLNRHQAAKAAGLSWYAVNEVLEPSGNPKLDTLKALDRLIPPDFVSPPRPQDAKAEQNPADLVGHPA